jgi:uncharacterized protein (TIGR03086 family)
MLQAVRVTWLLDRPPLGGERSVSAELLRKAFASTAGVLDNVSTDQMDLPTPCVSWTVRDLVNHIVAGPPFFATTAETGVAPVRTETDYTTGDFKAEFHQSAERAVKAFSAEGTMEKPMKLPFGELPGAVFVLIVSTDTFTHGWDLARATGQSTDLDPEVAATLYESVQFIPDEMRGRDGEKPFGPRVEAPASATAADRLAGFMGRPV